MSRIENAVTEIHDVSDLAERKLWINEVHPAILLTLTVVFLLTLLSFERYDLVGVTGMILYPCIMFQMADLSLKKCFLRLKTVLPLLLFIGILNPVFDHSFIIVNGMAVPGGILSMATLFLKGVFSVLAGYVLIATCSVEKICSALQFFHVPGILITQCMLMYRYITLLIEECSRTLQAYHMRAPRQKGIAMNAWGSLVGHLLLRSIDRAQDVYEAMALRGYDSGHPICYIENRKSGIKEILFLLVWLLVFALLRLTPLLQIIGKMVEEVL